MRRQTRSQAGFGREPLRRLPPISSRARQADTAGPACGGLRKVMLAPRLLGSLVR
jgi:hypothetical protein